MCDLCLAYRQGTPINPSAPKQRAAIDLAPMS
jgi:hypothetical protein